MARQVRSSGVSMEPPRSSTPPRRPARTAAPHDDGSGAVPREAIVTQPQPAHVYRPTSSAVAAASAASMIAASGGSIGMGQQGHPAVSSSCKWGEVVNSFPVMRQSNMSSWSEHGAYISPQASFQDAGSGLKGSVAPGADPSLGLNASSSFWQRHEEFALARSQQARELRRPAFEGPRDPSPRPLGVNSRSGLRLGGCADVSATQQPTRLTQVQQEPLAAGGVSGHPGICGAGLDPATTVAAATADWQIPPTDAATAVAAASAEMWRARALALAAVAASPAPCAANLSSLDDRGHRSVWTERDRLVDRTLRRSASLGSFEGVSSARPARLRSDIMVDPTLTEPLPPCLGELVRFLRRRVEDQGAQIAQLRAEMAARVRVLSAFQGVPLTS